MWPEKDLEGDCITTPSLHLEQLHPLLPSSPGYTEQAQSCPPWWIWPPHRGLGQNRLGSHVGGALGEVPDPVWFSRVRQLLSIVTSLCTRYVGWILSSAQSYFSLFRDKDIRAQRGWKMCPKSVSEQQRWTMNLDPLGSEFMLTATATTFHHTHRKEKECQLFQSISHSFRELWWGQHQSQTLGFEPQLQPLLVGWPWASYLPVALCHKFLLYQVRVMLVQTS